MELTDTANEFLGSSTFTLMVVGGVFVVAVLLRLLLGPVERGY